MNNVVFLTCIYSQHLAVIRIICVVRWIVLSIMYMLKTLRACSFFTEYILQDQIKCHDRPSTHNYLLCDLNKILERAFLMSRYSLCALTWPYCFPTRIILTCHVKLRISCLREKCKPRNYFKEPLAYALTSCWNYSKPINDPSICFSWVEVF